MPWWLPQLACFIGGVVYGVVCTLMVEGWRELGRLRAQQDRNLRDFLDGGTSYWSMRVEPSNPPIAKGDGGALEPPPLRSPKLWVSGARPPGNGP
jgi:hypothetical protein